MTYNKNIKIKSTFFLSFMERMFLKKEKKIKLK